MEPTLPESLGLLRNQPMTCLYVGEAKAWEETSDEGNHVIGDVFALCASDKESRLLEANSVWVLEGKVA
jgi:hypothetical protein